MLSLSTDGRGNDVLGCLGQWHESSQLEPCAALDFCACPVVIIRSVGVGGETELGEIDVPDRLAALILTGRSTYQVPTEPTDEFRAVAD